jgi:Helix-turn-helix domain
VQVAFEPADLRSIVEAVVAQLADRLGPIDDRLSVDEREGARLLSVPKHVLGDARRRGEIQAAKVGKKMLYLRSDLAVFLQSRKGL